MTSPVEVEAVMQALYLLACKYTDAKLSLIVKAPQILYTIIILTTIYTNKIRAGYAIE
jgi:hypothetical protein